MADTLETLEVEVKHNAGGADTAIGKVVAQIEQMGKALSGVLPQLKEYAETLSKIGGKVSAAKSKGKSKSESSPVPDDLQAKIRSAGKLEIAVHKAVAAQMQMQQAFESGNANAAWSAREKEINATAKAQSMLTKNTISFSEAVKQSLGPLGTFISSLKRIAMYRILRTIIKAITQAFTEGLKYAYEFSKGIETEGHRFSVAMDQMKSATTKMKAQLGSAFISLLTALMPIILKLVNLILLLADAMSQFFAAFTGSTYLKAQDIAVDFEDTMAGGAKAAKEWKNQLLGFDEINKLEAPSGGGGGASTGLDPSKMFEDAPLSEWAMKVREVVLWLQDHLELVKGIVAAIGAGFLGWKIASITGKILGVESGLARVAAGIALCVGGFVALTSGMMEWIQTGELTEDAFWKIEIGILAVGAGISLLTGSWIPLLVAAVVAAVFAIITQWNNIIAKIKEWRDKFKQYVGDGKITWHDFAFFFVDKIYTIIKAVEGFISWIRTLINWIRSAVDWINNLGSVTGNNGGTFLSGYTPGQYASGGYVASGQMFIAREAGPEMVGTIGGQTAVANNDDIVTAVSRGVFEAVSQAMSSSGGRGGEVVLNINGREFARATYDDRRMVDRERGTRLVNT